MTDKQIKDVREFLEDEFWIKNDNYEMYTDYNDVIDERTVEKWLKAKRPLDAFSEEVCKWETDSFDYYYPEIIEKLTEHFPDIDEQELSDWVDNNITYSFDKDFGEQEVFVEFSLDVGNLNYDNTCDNILNYADSYGYNFENSSMLWLAKKLKIKTDLQNAIAYERGKKEKYKYTNPLVQGFISEFQNNCTSMSTVTFCCTMSIYNLLTLKEAVFDSNLKKLNPDYEHYNPLKYPTGKTIKLPKGITFGLWDYSNGGGSFYECLRLPKDIEIPLEVISHLFTANHRYGVNDSCGMCSEVYDTVLDGDFAKYIA